jgi:hypothetical protein
MATTYSTNLALTLQGTNDNPGTWGDITNTNLGTLLEQAISGYVTQAVATGTDTIITIPNGASGVARNMYIELTGTGGTNTNLIVPANKKLYFVYNNASGAVTVKVSGQTGVSILAGEKKILVSNGTDIVEATSYITSAVGSLTLTTLTATSANITTVTGTTAGFSSANITNISSAVGAFTLVTANTVSSTNGSFTSANITTVTGSSATITNILDGSGNVRTVPSVGAAKTSNYTLSVSDVGKFITIGASGSITVPNDVFAAGDAISFFNNTSTSKSITLSITTAYVSGVDIDKSVMTLDTRGAATVLFINPSLCVFTGAVR